MKPVNSTTFIKRPPSITPKEETLLYTKEILCGRLFIGLYKERKYVSALDQYRDVVAVSTEEIEMHQALDKVIRKWKNVENIKWVGITGPEVSGTQKEYLFWVNFCNLPFDHYWFQIKHVKLKNEEIILQLKCIRKYFLSLKTASQSCFIKNETPDPTTSADSTSKNYFTPFNSKKLLSSFQKAFNETIYQVEPFITWQNFFAFIKVGFALIITIIFGSLSSIKFLGEFTLKLIRELSVLIQAISPIVIHIIDFCSKVVGGFFILLAGVFRAFSPTHVYMDSSGSNTYANIGNSNMNSNPPLNWRERNRILRQEFLKISYKKS